MAQQTQAASRPVSESVYAQVQHFYARQMQLLDSGETDEWARTFTEDGVFVVGGVPEPVRGRANIATGARQVADQFAEAGIIRRHLISMIAIDPRDDGALDARSYALVLEIEKGGDVTLRRSTVCQDVLVAIDEAAGWLVRHREVTRDGLD